MDKTDDRVGLISLEESVGDTAEKFISMSLKRPVNDPPPLTPEEIRAGFEAVFKDERLVLPRHQGSVGDDSLIDKIEYMALMGCKYLVLDHITIAVSEGSEGLSGNEAIDKVMSDLLKVVKRHNVWLGLISHLRKSQGGRSFEEGKLASIDDIKGSGSIKQISFDIVPSLGTSLQRTQTNETQSDLEYLSPDSRASLAMQEQQFMTQPPLVYQMQQIASKTLRYDNNYISNRSYCCRT